MKKQIHSLFLFSLVMVLLSGCANPLSFENSMDVTKVSIPVNTVIVDAQGHEVDQLYNQENREYAKLSEMPEYLIRGFLITEDKRFYEHAGVDPQGIFRAIYKDAASQSLREGASTITQQVAKNAFLTQEKTVGRKLNEMAIAIELEKHYSKEQILEMYVNLIYFGEGAYGVKTAAKAYFGKDLQHLSISEAALLAGLPKAPSAYSPRHDIDKALQRRNTVLSLMRENGVITEQQEWDAQHVEVKLVSEQPDSNRYPAYVDYVLKEAGDLLHIEEKQLLSGGYRIYTGFDPAVQKAMDRAVASHPFPDDRKDRGVDVGIAALKPETGAIAALYGGRQYQPKGVNHATASFQPGSALKPIAAYVPAIETKGWKPNDLISDEPMTFVHGYAPQNYGDKYYGKVTLYEALARSLNVPAVYLLNDAGIQAGARYVEAAGIKLDPKDKGLSIALGGLTKGVSAVQLAQAYPAFANHGTVTGAHAIIEIKDRNGQTILKQEPMRQNIMKPETADTMSAMLQGVITEPFGTGRSADFGKPAAGKTGTTQAPGLGPEANKDAWFVGYTSELATAIHIGFDITDREHYLSNGGGREPAQLFSTVMKQVYGR
ncbi:PBP1A family penicillin-binding protein [Paenibacillus aurantius]|uniref:PBP1A family penicillin-binding protein n=1 Tax=Paenibacillus aurantius TaxID=2918900 RepID=A0AA96LG03_9BACL|nr:PBP1A family penicillin-binding protein [Paenibacillus aurantius]WNQ12529.1 PBP1A family penicillin-binding protein [Paenibacillus aurantius]